MTSRERVEEKQQELGGRRDRAAHVADRDHLRALDPRVPPRESERDPVVGDVRANRAPRVEAAVLAVELPPRVAAREALRHPPHDAPHAVEVPGRDVRKAHPLQELLAEPRGRGVRVEGDVALDEVAGSP